jgi:metal-dependent amidase/aminoacylase/carboxypeptidase family protein
MELTMRIAKFRGVWPPTLCLSLAPAAWAQDQVPLESIESLGAAISSRVASWRRDFHQNPELSNREFRTAAIVAEHLAGLGLEVQLPWSSSYPITYNDPDLTAEMRPVLEAVAGPDGVEMVKPITGAEDFSFFADEVPGLHISLGGKPPGTPKEQVAAHHTPDFHIDESGFDVGVRAMAAMAWQYMVNHDEE